LGVLHAARGLVASAHGAASGVSQRLRSRLGSIVAQQRNQLALRTSADPPLSAGEREQRRKRRLKPAMRRNFACSVACLVATFMLEAACCSVYATQRAGQWMQRPYGPQRADIVETFGGHCAVSMGAAKQGWLALQPYDSKYGCDLSKSQGERGDAPGSRKAATSSCPRRIPLHLLVIAPEHQLRAEPATSPPFEKVQKTRTVPFPALRGRVREATRSRR